MKCIARFWIFCPSSVGLPLLGAAAQMQSFAVLQDPLAWSCLPSVLLPSSPFFHPHSERTGRTLATLCVEQDKYLFSTTTYNVCRLPWCTPWHPLVLFHLNVSFRLSQPWLDDVAFICPSGPQVDSRWPCCACGCSLCRLWLCDSWIRTPNSKRTTKSNHQIRSTWLGNWRRQSQTLQRKENERKVDTASGSRCSRCFPWLSAFLQQVLQSLFICNNNIMNII